MYLRPTGTISRIHINKILKSMTISKKHILTAKVIDYTNCPNSCTLINKNNFSLCTNDCDNYKLKLIDNDTLNQPHILTEEYIDDGYTKYEKKLSRFQLLQYISYHFLPLSKNGEYNYLLESDISKLIGCSVKTVKRNNELLNAVGLINYRYEDIGLISVHIINYEKSFEVNGKGGVVVPLNLFKELCKLKNIDELRFSLFMYEKYISGENYYGTDYFCTMALNKFKRLTAKGNRYNKKIFEIIQKLVPLIKLSADGPSSKVVNFKLYKHFVGNNYKDNFKNIATSEILNKLEEKQMNSTNKDMDDLISLAMQYGKEAVLSALNKYTKPIKEQKKIKLGATIRNIIRETYYNSIGVEIDVA